MNPSHPRLAPEPSRPELSRPEPEPSPGDRIRMLFEQLTQIQTRWLGALAALVGGVLVVAVLVVAAVWPGDAGGPPVETRLPLATPAPAPSTTIATELIVHVAGAVVTPGLLVLEHGARVADAVSAAGGLAASADLGRINLAALVSDAQRIYIPVLGEEIPAEIGLDSRPGQPAEALPVDINTADRDLLDTLPGIGPATAEAIVDYREQVGSFRSVEGLLEVPGIGPAKLETLRDRVRVG